MYKLEKQIIEMENFASHLEEVFITVEVRAHLTTLSDTHVISIGGGVSSCVWHQLENLFSWNVSSQYCPSPLTLLSALP